MDFLKKLNITELIEAYSQIISLLKERKVIRTKNLIGDLAEYLIINHYNNTAGLSNLQAAPAGTQNVDALSRQGARYSIKATTGNLTGVFYGLNSPQSTEKEIQKFEFIIVACFDENYNLVRIIELTWEQFLKNKRWHKTMNAWNISITKQLTKECKIIFETGEKVKSYSIEEKRKHNKNAYASWIKEDDNKLELLYCEGKEIKYISKVFGRNEGAIRSRIKKLELGEKYDKK